MTREEKNSDDREYYKMLKRLHICRGCKEQDAYTLAGRTYCAECAAEGARKKREWRKQPANREKIADANMKQRERYDLENRCTRCGRPLPEFSKFKTCIECRVARRKAHKKKRIDDGVNYPRGANGYCYQCNKLPALEGKRLCAVCYENKMSCLAKAADRAWATNATHVWRGKAVFDVKGQVLL